MLYLTGVVLTAFFLFLLSAYLKLIDLATIVIRGENGIFWDTIQAAKWKFNHLYYLHTIVFYCFTIIGAFVFFNWLFKKTFSKVCRLIWANKTTYWRELLFVMLVCVFLLMLMAKESHLRYLSFCPGSCYPGNDFTEENPQISWNVKADENGMTFYNYDSFPNPAIGDSTMFIVNRQGFPSRFDFDKSTIDSLANKCGSKKLKVLFIGDSFLEGIGASSFDKSFVEIYRRKNVDKVVCSAGIRGMDVVQYRLVAEKFIPEILPGKVTVMFCGWNDIMLTERKPVAFLPYFVDVKNVGVINNYIPVGITPFDTLALAPDSAYRLYRQRYSLMTRQDVLSKICRQTCITTQLYFLLNSVQYFPSQFNNDYKATYRNLKRIKNVCDSVGAKFSIVFIPTPIMKKYDKQEYKNKYQWVFLDLLPDVHFPPKNTVQENDCSTSIDFHLNDTGQKKMAEYLEKEFKD